jgi:hypothetical protein
MEPQMDATPTQHTAERAQALAASLDCLTEQDLCDLFKITPSTAENWRKRGLGPAFTRAGNRVLYPRSSVADFLKQQLRERPHAAARSAL